MAVSTIDALYNGTSEKLTTSATGITVTGTVAATAYTGDGSALTGTGSPSIVDNGNATAMTITSDENVGIGVTPSSAYKMQVAVATNTPSTGSPAASSLAAISGGTTTVGDGVSLQLNNTSGAKETAWRMSAVTTSGNNGDLVFNGYTGGATYPERMRILSGGGITFNGDTAAANALNDYEEGTWTPAPSVGSASSASGTYTKIGRMVVVTGFVSGMNTVNNETLNIGGLPFTGGNIVQCIGQAMWSNVDKEFGYEQVFYTGGSKLQFYHTTNANFDAIRHIDLDGSNSACYFSATYFV